MKVLVTGANGYIGSRVVQKLLDRNIEVLAADISGEHIDPRAQVCLVNLFEPKENWYDFFGEPDVCLHMGLRDGFVHNSTKNIEDVSNHFVFLKNLLDHGLKHVVSMGSMHEVGYYEGMVREDTPCKPLSLYGIAKYALRESLKLYSQQKNVVFQWLRGYYIYGDDSFGNSIFCKIRRAVESGQTHFPFTSGKNKYDFLHIDKLSEYIARCVIQSDVTGIIDICSGIPVSLGEMVESYIIKNGLQIVLDYGKFSDRAYDSPCLYGDVSKLNKILEVTL